MNSVILGGSNGSIVRFTADNRCPVCGGHQDMPRGEGSRCAGYLLPDGAACVCTREEHDGDITATGNRDMNGNAFHRLAAAANIKNTNGGSKKTRNVEYYDYFDADGAFRFQVIRRHIIGTNGNDLIDDMTGKPRKDFIQRQKGPDGEWVWNLQGVEPILYRLPQLLAADHSLPVYVTEGERHADRLSEMGFNATTAPMGAGKWRDAYNEYLRWRQVVILPDNDLPGREHAQKIAQALSGVAASVRILLLPNLPEKGDILDWLSAGGTADELQRMASECPVWSPAAGKASRAICFDKIQAESVSWLWPNRIALGKVSIIAGDPGLGKSFLTVDMAARISTGARWPDGTPVVQGGALLLNAEDDPGDTIKPRLLAAGADCSRIFTLPFTDCGDIRDVQAIGEAVDRIDKCRLVAIDPISAYLGGVDSYKNADVRQALAPLTEFASKRKIAVVLISHLNKSSQQSALNRISGSGAFAAAARSAWVVGRDPEDSAARLLLPLKNNLGNDRSGLRFWIDGEDAPRVEWDNEPVYQSADEILQQSSNEPAKSKADDARIFLSGLLSDGALSVSDVRSACKTAGYSWATVRRAKAELQIESIKSTFSDGWMWKFDEGAQKSSKVLNNIDEHLRQKMSTFDTERERIII